MAPRVLAVGAHPDDVELGCGGTLATHARVGHEITILVLTDGEGGPGEVADRRREATNAANILGATIRFAGLPDGNLDPGVESVTAVERVIGETSPSIIYAHANNDWHQDHRHAAAVTTAAARDHSVLLHFRSPSTTTFDPVIFVPITKGDLGTKIEALAAHRSQVVNSRRVDVDNIHTTARFWGTIAGSELAEPFEATRVLAHVSEAGLLV